MDNMSSDDGFRAFRNVVHSLMKDASAVIADADVAATQGELRERLDLVSHYISYALRYCTDCPLIRDERKATLPFKTIQFPGAN